MQLSATNRDDVVVSRWQQAVSLAQSLIVDSKRNNRCSCIARSLTAICETSKFVDLTAELYASTAFAQMCAVAMNDFSMFVGDSQLAQASTAQMSDDLLRSFDPEQPADLLSVSSVRS